MRLTYDDYKKVQKNWNTKAIKTDCTTQFIYKGFLLHRCRDSQWGFTYYDIWKTELSSLIAEYLVLSYTAMI